MSISFDAVRKFALTLDHAEESTSYATPAFKVRGAPFARLKEDGKTLVVRASFEERDEMIAADPGICFITDHYLNYEWVLVRLNKVHPDAMRDLLRAAHKSASADKKPSTKRRSQR
jgi:hypothetical protein